MKNKIVFFIFVLIMNISCSSNSNTTLQRKIITKEPGYFSLEDDFMILGKTQNYTVAYNQHFWGNNRMTGRIIIFENGEPVGSYGGISDIPIVKDEYLIFLEYNEKYGNMIDLSSGIPSKVYLDGEHFSFEYY